MKYFRNVVFTLLIVVFASSQLSAATSSSSNFILETSVISGGGATTVQSSQYELTGTLGQSLATGMPSSESYKSRTGFWEALASKIIDQGDVNGDGQTDLVDIVLALQVVTGVNVSLELVRDADINNDNKIGLPEAIAILKIISE